jgi:hypothetical protein
MVFVYLVKVVVERGRERRANGVGGS